MGMCIQQYLVTSSMNFRILADHTEQFCCFCHSFIVRGIQVHLPHMECLIATVDVSGCPVIKPQSCFLPGQIRNPPVFCRILSPAGKSAGICIHSSSENPSFFTTIRQSPPPFFPKFPKIFRCRPSFLQENFCLLFFCLIRPSDLHLIHTPHTFPLYIYTVSRLYRGNLDRLIILSLRYQ